MKSLRTDPLGSPFRGEVYWTADVAISGKPGGYMSRGFGNPESALTDGMEMATYYILECGHGASIGINVHCNRCQSTGTISIGKRVVRTKPCPDCKGEGSRILLTFPAAVHANAIHRHVPCSA